MSISVRARIVALAAACLAVVPAGLPRAAATGDSATYVSGGTAVARANGQPVVDEGTVVCDDGSGVGTGGVCLAFGGGDAVEVVDQLSGQDVAFQVCVDNSGDGVCTSPDFSGHCPDQIAFSHDDDGAFYNPVGPLPTGFLPGCAGGPWKGYVVLLCEGAHVVGADVHAHGASSGEATVTSGGEGLGTFCGGGPQPSRKPYVVGSGARYVSGGTAVARQDGQPVVDEGAVACNNGDNVGVGGFCLSFGGGDAVAVADAASGTNVAYQVCVDNSGDGVCTSPDNRQVCADVVVFSHDDDGAFYNPVGPVPTGFAPGCGRGAWNGYVVFLCEGTHLDGVVPHAHGATTGTGRVTSGGEGTGTFCGGSYQAPSHKRYRLDLDTPTPDPCRLVAVRSASATGQNFEGAVEGGPVTAADAGAPPDATLTLRCSVVVNGSEVASSPTASGIGLVVVGPSPVAFAAGDTDQVTVCTEITSSHGTSRDCEPAASTSPAGQREVADAVEAVSRDVLDPARCPLLAALAGAYGPVVISAAGDVFVNGEPVLDCPPYDLGVPSPTDREDLLLIAAGF